MILSWLFILPHAKNGRNWITASAPSSRKNSRNVWIIPVSPQPSSMDTRTVIRSNSKPRTIGYRLIYQVLDKEVLAVGKREQRSVAYHKAQGR